MHHRELEASSKFHEIHRSFSNHKNSHFVAKERSPGTWRFKRESKFFHEVLNGVLGVWLSIPIGKERQTGDLNLKAGHQCDDEIELHASQPHIWPPGVKLEKKQWILATHLPNMHLQRIYWSQWLLLIPSVCYKMGYKIQPLCFEEKNMAPRPLWKKSFVEWGSFPSCAKMGVCGGCFLSRVLSKVKLHNTD